MYAIISYHNSTYQPLADLTWTANKLLYAQRHGYHCEMETITDSNGTAIQHQKVAFINRMLNDSRNFEWVWWTGCDLMITNYDVKLEDRIDNNYHMVIATDCNGINADSILIKNNEEGRAFWKMVGEVLPTLNGHWEGEQKVIKDSYPNHKKKIKIVPQRQMNSYDYNIWGGHYKPFDQMGNDGQWQKGDWAIHWPGTSLENRIKLAKHFTEQTIK